MHINHQIGPNVMDGLEFIFLDDAFEKDLHPGWYAHNDADVPLGSGLHHEVHLFGPVFHLRNLLPWLVKGFKPRWNLARRNTRKVARIIAKFLVILQVGAAANHQNTTVVEADREIVARGRNQLTDSSTGNLVVYAFSNRDIFAGRLRSARTERKILDFSWPCDVTLTLQVEVPPLVVHLVVVEHGHTFAILLQNIGRQQNLIKMIELSEFREPRFDQQFAQFAPLCTNRVSMVLTNLDGYILDLRSSLHQGSHNRDGHVLSSNNR